MKKITVKEIDYHRNGVSGVGFHVVTFYCHENKQNMIATVFPLDENQTWNGMIAVYSMDLLKKDVIKFGENSWRGDNYESALRDAINKHDAILYA